MVSEMVERVARALAAGRNARRIKDGDEDIGILPSDLDDARAAIEAMREPTEKMALAPRDMEISAGRAEFIWHEMIDAALA